MPDWSYQTCFRPLLFRLPPRLAQSIAIGCLGRLGQFWFGRQVVRFMGHMVPNPSLSFRHRNVTFQSRIGVCAGLDSQAVATGSLNQFGLAFIEYGPLTESAVEDSHVRFDADQECVSLSSPEQNPGFPLVEKLAFQVAKQKTSTQILMRFDATVHPDDMARVVSGSRSSVFGFVVPWRDAADVMERLKNRSGLPLIFILASADLDVEQIATIAGRESVDGVLIDSSLSFNTPQRIMSPKNLDATLTFTRKVRERIGPGKLIIATGGVYEPIDALRVRQSGADIVGVDSGMVVAGPGLAKRCNELLAQTEFLDSECKAQSVDLSDQESPPSRQSWFWAFLLGISLVGGGLLALYIAMTRVVLPYDESVVGMTRAELMLINDRIIDFMAHDRVTLAGTMLSVGILYSCLAFFAIRFGAHWARQSIIYSAFVGFFTFFLFLGYGYFDPFHAFVTTILFQFLLMMLYARMRKRPSPMRLDLHNDSKWSRAQWGQLLFLIKGFVLVVAGTIISKIGISSVFVAEDLEFLCTTRDQLITANPQLLSLVAHDRATFGGMLICSGITVFLSALWGFRRGHVWLWWALLMSGLCGYIPTIVIHQRVGYTSLIHLLPAYGGLMWLCVAAFLCFGYFHDQVRTIDAN